MTRGSIREYTEAVQERYLHGSKKEKGKILDEFTNVTGRHRKTAIRLLHRGNQVRTNKKRGRPRQYGAVVVGALRVAWEATDRLEHKRLCPFLPELVTVLRRHGDRTIDAEIETQLCQISPSTIDRLLRPYRRLGGRHPFTTTKLGSLLKNSIPIRTFTDWQEDCSGFLEVNLVSHCGESTEGFYLTTLCTVDVASGWSECLGVWGRGQERVGGAVHKIRQRLPFPLLGLDSDNGGEDPEEIMGTLNGQLESEIDPSRIYQRAVVDGTLNKQGQQEIAEAVERAKRAYEIATQSLFRDVSSYSFDNYRRER